MKELRHPSGTDIRPRIKKTTADRVVAKAGRRLGLSFEEALVDVITKFEIMENKLDHKRARLSSEHQRADGGTPQR